MAVIVIDALQAKKFNEDELQFCSDVADLMSRAGEAYFTAFQGCDINRTVPLGEFAKRLRENLSMNSGELCFSSFSCNSLVTDLLFAK